MDKGLHGRKDRLIKQKTHDTYKCKDKLHDNTACSSCGVSFVGGRWVWTDTASTKNTVICPACRRCADNYPAGYVELKGDFFAAHREEIFNLSKKVEQQEKMRHPMERIMTITDMGDHTLLTTTGVHLARRIGQALSQSYKGDYSFNYAQDENKVRVYWQR